MAPYEGPILPTPHFRRGYVRDPKGILLEIWDAPGSRDSSADTY